MIHFGYNLGRHISRRSTKRINGLVLGTSQAKSKIDQFDLLEFSQYLENILIQKNKIKLTELKISIKDRLEECFIYNR